VDNFSTGDVPGIAARMCKFLRFGQIRLAAAQCFFSKFALGLHLCFANSSTNRRRDSRKARLEYIIGGAQLECFDRYFLVEGTGDEDERHVGTGFFRQFQCRNALKLPKSIVSEDEIETPVFKRGEKLRPAVNPGQITVDPFGFQSCLKRAARR